MKKIFLISFVISSCLHTNNRSAPSAATSIDSSIDESFSVFFEKFKSDSSMQKERIFAPLSIGELSDDSEVEWRKEEIKFISFNEGDWGGKTALKFVPNRTDSVKVILQVVDTGIHIEHFFFLKEGRWYLYKILNASD